MKCDRNSNICSTLDDMMKFSLHVHDIHIKCSCNKIFECFIETTVSLETIGNNLKVILYAHCGMF